MAATGIAAAPTVRHARWWPPLVLVAVMAFVVLGGYVVTGALSTARGAPVTVGATVTIFPLSEWEVAAEGDLDGIPAMRLTRGTGSLDTLAPISSSDPDEVLRDYVKTVLQPNADRLDVSEEIDHPEVPYGSAARVSYVGLFGERASWIEGQVTVVTTFDGRSIVYDGWGPEGLFGYSLSDIETMIADAEVTA